MVFQALTRMAARRGWPGDMVGDNGINFVGGTNELRELVNQLIKQKLNLLHPIKKSIYTGTHQHLTLVWFSSEWLGLPSVQLKQY